METNLEDEDLRYIQVVQDLDEDLALIQNQIVKIKSNGEKKIE